MLLIILSAILIHSLIRVKKEYSLKKKVLLNLSRIFVLMISAFFILSKSYYVDRVYLKNENTQVIFQGMSHHADESFYHSVNYFIDIKKDYGYVHLYEMILVKEEHKEIMNTKLSKIISKSLSSSTLASQSDKFKMDQKDIRADMTSSEYLEGLKTHNILTNENLIFTNDENNSYNTLIKIGLNAGESLTDRSFIFLDFVMRTNIYDKVIKRRNEKAVEFIKSEINKGNNKIIISYGNMHKRGIVDLLIKNGFEITKEEKVLAIK